MYINEQLSLCFGLQNLTRNDYTFTVYILHLRSYDHAGLNLFSLTCSSLWYHHKCQLFCSGLLATQGDLKLEGQVFKHDDTELGYRLEALLLLQTDTNRVNTVLRMLVTEKG